LELCNKIYNWEYWVLSPEDYKGEYMKAYKGKGIDTMMEYCLGM
jgi:hypothetical protein